MTKKMKLHLEMVALANNLFGNNYRFVGFAIANAYDNITTKNIVIEIEKLKREGAKNV